MMTVQSPFDLVFGGGDTRQSYYSAYDAEDEYDLIAEQRLRQHYAALQRQAEVERERELRRRRIQHEQRRRREAEAAALAAAAAWQAEQERKQQALLERRRREREAAQAAAAAQRQRYLVQVQERRQAAASAQQQWEDFAIHGLAGALQLAGQFFDIFNGDEETAEKEQKEVQVHAKDSTNNVEAEPKDTTMQPSESEVASNEQRAVVDAEENQDPPEVALEQSFTQQIADAQPQLVFSYPLPKSESQRAAIKADNIKVDFDEATHSIHIKGLWDATDIDVSDSHSTISAQSDDEASTRGRKRSRSPKRSRVSDVDEKTGEEIVKDVEQDGFVDLASSVAAGKQAQGTAKVPVPEGAGLSSLRAELTDDEFRVYL